MRTKGTFGEVAHYQRITWLLALAAITACLLMPWVAQAKALQTTIHEIILDSPQYSGKSLTVEGIVKALKEGTSRTHATSFELTAAHSPSSVQVLARKRLALKEGDYVRVTGRYKQKVDGPPCCWHGAIEAATVTKVNKEICP
jgi:hypothetical protein